MKKNVKIQRVSYVYSVVTWVLVVTKTHEKARVSNNSFIFVLLLVRVPVVLNSNQHILWAYGQMDRLWLGS
jgi:hypothetical protein